MEERSEPSEEQEAQPPHHKKRRTLRACAACRRRKIKCDGLLPCTACSASGLSDCSYDDIDRRRSAPGYIQNLEKKVEELEALLGSPHKDTSLGAESTQSTRTTSRRETLEREDTRTTTNNSSGRSQTSRTPQVEDDELLETMVGTEDAHPSHTRSTNERYWGNFAGLSLLQRMRKLCSDVAGLHRGAEGDAVEDDFIHSFDCASPTDPSSMTWETFALLPSKERMLECVDIASNIACCNLHFLDLDYIHEKIDYFYGPEIDEYSQSDRKALALLYVILALGRRFEPDRVPYANSANEKPPAVKGLRYFRASRGLLDVADCHDVATLQTVLCMIIYMQASSMMSTCYSYICAGVAASLRLGLHVSSASEGLPEHERDIRRRIFSVLNILDTYVTVALGLPKTLRDVESDHLLPLPTPATPDDFASPLAATQAHAALITILAKVVDSNHPVTKPISQKNGFYSVEYKNVVAIEEDLDRWFSALPSELPSSGADAQHMRSQLLLRLAYAHVQMVLYRPFLHHAAKDLRPFCEIHYKAYACGSACVKAAMQAVWLAEALDGRGLFNEAHWFVTLTVSFAATILKLFVLSNEGDPTIRETAEAAERIRELLARYAERSASARRCSVFLEELSQSHARTDSQHHVEVVGDSNKPSANDAANDAAMFVHQSHNFANHPEWPHTGVGSDHDEHTLQAMAYPRLQPYLDEL